MFGNWLLVKLLKNIFYCPIIKAIIQYLQLRLFKLSYPGTYLHFINVLTSMNELKATLLENSRPVKSSNWSQWVSEFSTRYQKPLKKFLDIEMRKLFVSSEAWKVFEFFCWFRYHIFPHTWATAIIVITVLPDMLF